MVSSLPRTEPYYDPQRPRELGLGRFVPAPPLALQPVARILVSDDDPAIRRIYTALLTAHGMEIVEVPGGDGWATLELVRSVRPWLLLTDVNKPGLDGQRLRAMVRADRRTARMPILTVSAIDLHTPDQGPLDDTLLKPFSFGLLLYRLTALLPLTSAAHTRLAAYALAHPGIEETHPITGLPALHAVAAALPIATAQPGWAAVSVSLADFRRQVRLRGRIGAEALLTRMAGALRGCANDLLIGHTGLDAQIVIAGPAPLVARAAAQVQSGFDGARALAARLAPHAPMPLFRIRHADARHGYGLNLLDLRRALG
jgi:CheY-like chemotaxis protein